LLVPVEREKYPQTKDWMERMNKLLPDNEEINLKGAQFLQTRILSCMAENKAKSQ